MMTHKTSYKTWLIPFVTASFVFVGVFASVSRADLSESQYQEALSIAQKKVARQKSLNSQSGNALSSSLIRNLYGRYYKVGDNWDVAAWVFNNTMARMTSDPDQLETKSGRAAIFHYEVKDVKNGAKPEVTIEVTQREDFGLKKPDSRVVNLKLFMNDQMLQSQKTYTINDREGKAHRVQVSPEGIHSAITSLELFPLDVPELLTAETSHPTAVPQLPQGLQTVAQQAGFKADAAHAFWFDQDDFFGRPIQAMWQSGDPWPAYYRTINGVSILIRKGAP